jgi:hypothetical protein
VNYDLTPVIAVHLTVRHDGRIGLHAPGSVECRGWANCQTLALPVIEPAAGGVPERADGERP